MDIAIDDNHGPVTTECKSDYCIDCMYMMYCEDVVKYLASKGIKLPMWMTLPERHIIYESYQTEAVDALYKNMP